MLAGVIVPVSGSVGPSAGQLSHLEAIRQELIARDNPPARVPATAASAASRSARLELAAQDAQMGPQEP